MTGVLRRYWWLAGGAIGVIASLGLIGTSHAWGAASTSVGWFAYSPLSESGETAVEEFTRRVDQMWLGVAVGVVSLLVIALGVGYRLGLRRSSGPRTSSP